MEQTPMGIIKINYDAIASLHKAAPAIIARDQKASYKQVELEYSCFGEWSKEKNPPLTKFSYKIGCNLRIQFFFNLILLHILKI